MIPRLPERRRTPFCITEYRFFSSLIFLLRKKSLSPRLFSSSFDDKEQHRKNYAKVMLHVAGIAAQPIRCPMHVRQSFKSSLTPVRSFVIGFLLLPVSYYLHFTAGLNKCHRVI